MSVTVTCNRKASAFASRDGKTIFVLNETAYESNLYPHTKHCHIVGIGDLPTVMQKIFSYASAVEGGALNSPDRTMTPERYIKSWLNAIKKPFCFDAVSTGSLDLTCHNSWDKERFAKLQTAIAERGTADNLLNHYDLVEEFRAYAAVSAPFSDSGQALTDRYPYGYKPVKTATPLQIKYPRVVRIPSAYGPNGERYYILVDADGHGITQPEWEYRVVGDFVAAFWPSELASPGSYMSGIPAFRDALRKMDVADPQHILCTIPAVTDADSDGPRSRREIEAKYGQSFLLSAVNEDDISTLYRSKVNFQMN